MLAKEAAAAGGKNFCRGRSGADGAAETVYRAAFDVDAGEKRRGYVLLAFAEERVRLLGGLDVAGKEDHACWLNLREQGSQVRRNLSSVEADD